jgi:TRAP-type C4-dicarboxylate transport system permease small subunit
MNMRNRDSLGRFLTPFDILLTTAVIVTCLEVLVEVSFRYVLNMPLSWGAEVSQTLLVWITFVGAALALYRSEHMVIKLAVNKVSSLALRRVLEGVAHLAVLGFLVLGTWSGWQVVERTWSMQTTSLQIPAGVLYMAFPTGCFLMIFVVLRDLVQVWKE